MNDLEDVTIQLVHETERAWLVTDGTIDLKTGKRIDVWIAKSVSELSREKGGNLWTLTAPEWLLHEKGLL